jgi:lactate dehydrogenase-like 2-hydroxyacid dehydrogenase
VARLAVTARLSDPEAAERLRAAGHEVAVRDDPRSASAADLRELAAGREGLLCLPADRIDAAFLDACPALRWVSVHAVGTDNVDLDAAAERGVAVANTPGVLDDAVADHCVALALAAARRVAEGDRLVRAGGWTGFRPTCCWASTSRAPPPAWWAWAASAGPWPGGWWAASGCGASTSPAVPTPRTRPRSRSSAPTSTACSGPATS